MLVAVVASSAVLAAVTQLGSSGSPYSAVAVPGRSFRWLVAANAPSDWKHAVLASGTAVLSYPPQFRSVSSDAGTVSEALFDQRGNYVAYLNATPRQGNERLDTWPSFRLEHQRDEAVSLVTKDAQSSDVRFLGGTGRCVVDDYVTRVAHNSYREIACFVQGGGGASVVVAAAPPAQWPRIGSVLEQAIAAYRVRSVR